MHMSEKIQEEVEAAIAGVLQENEAFLECFLAHVRYSRVDPDGEIYQAFAAVRSESANIYELAGMGQHLNSMIADEMKEWEDI
jgi:hypothetical protein